MLLSLVTIVAVWATVHSLYMCLRLYSGREHRLRLEFIGFVCLAAICVVAIWWVFATASMEVHQRQAQVRRLWYDTMSKELDKVAEAGEWHPVKDAPLVIERQHDLELYESLYGKVEMLIGDEDD